MVYRKGVMVLAAVLLIPVARTVGCQLVAQDSARVSAAREAGRRSADSSSTAGWFVAGLVGVLNPVLPVLGAPVALAYASGGVRREVPVRYRAALAGEPGFVAEAFAGSYAARLRQRRTDAVLGGALVGGGVVLVALLYALGHWE